MKWREEEEKNNRQSRSREKLAEKLMHRRPAKQIEEEKNCRTIC
jgi:hypothetical protein